MSSEIITLCCNYPIDNTLLDRRFKKYGSTLGNLSTLSKQYGITIEEKNGYRFYSAPKRRMKFFLEILHFANVPYTIV